MKIHFADGETTGLTEDDEIIEFAIATWDSEASPRVEMRYHAYFFPLGECHPGAARINGYSPEAWAAKISGPRAGFLGYGACRAIAAELEGLTYWGGSNPGFDISKLQEAFRRVRVPWPKMGHRKIDTSAMALPLVILGKVTSTGLGALMQHFGLGAQTHTAKEDVLNTIAVFERLLALSIKGFGT